MDLVVTRLQLTGGPGRRLPVDPAVYGMPTRELDERVADQIFNDPALDGLRKEVDIVNQLAQVDDVGIVLLVQMLNQSDGEPMDISNASDLEIIIGYPGGARVTKTAILYTDGIDGKFYYVSQLDDFPISGDHNIQGKVTINDNVYFGEVSKFSVLPNIVPETPPPGPDPHVGTFINSDLVSNIFTIVHDKALDPPFTIDVTIFDNNGREITPDQVIGAENSVGIDLTSFVPLSGTWGYVYI